MFGATEGSNAVAESNGCVCAATIMTLKEDQQVNVRASGARLRFFADSVPGTLFCSAKSCEGTVL
jgi:hypothetical protein